jgi:hypothetical protein
MPRRPTQSEQFGSDSFLDVVANVVGILIILVMMVGMRVKNVPARGDEQPAAALDLSQPRAVAQSLQDETLRLADQTSSLDLEAQQRLDRERQLAAELDAQRRELEASRRSLDVQAQADLSAQREVWAAQSLAQQLERDLAQTATAKTSTKIESYPTAIARTVEGKEAHFQLRGGRIAYIPLEELLAQLKNDAQSQFWKLKDLPEATSTVGPLGGFRLRYTFERVDVPLEDQMSSKRFISSYAQLSQWTLIPTDSLIGETLEEALAERSDFRLALAKLNKRQTTVTLWVYPDSFSAFRAVKKEMYLQGIATAGRPLPDDTPIGGSPRGSKSAAQ